MSILLGERTPRFGAVVVLVVALALAGLVAATLLARPALAATIAVDTTADEDNIDGDCSLREAVIAANTDAARDACIAGTGADTITVPAGTYTLTLVGAGENAALVGDLDVTGSTTINGEGARTTILQGRAGFDDRIFENTPVAPTATTTISGLTITGGNAGTEDGGGVGNAAGNLTLREVAVDNNEADDAGGVDHQGGNLTVERSTISNNKANGQPAVSTGDGGAIQNDGTLLTITNSTVTNNNSLDSGGAIDDDGGASAITNSTIAFNTAGDAAGGAIADTEANETFKNTIVAKNTDAAAGTATDNCEGAGTSQGHNLEDLNTCGFGAPTDRPNTEPNLGDLANNGGQTDTRALLAASPAIDTGDADAATDQRGVTRPLDGDKNGPAIDDRGAFEKEGAACSDGKDNDNDNKIDFPKDKGCKSATDNKEKNKKKKKKK